MLGAMFGVWVDFSFLFIPLCFLNDISLSALAV